MLKEGSEFSFLLKIENGKKQESESCIKETTYKSLCLITETYIIQKEKVSKVQ
jgi:hypothetical protein